MNDAIACTEHPDAHAGWRCTTESCRHYLCGKCTARLIELHTCCACGGPARQLTISRKLKPWSHWAGAALRQPFGAGLPIAAGAAFVLGGVTFAARNFAPVAHQLDSIATIARVGVLAVYLLLTISGAVRGSERGTLLRVARTLTGALWIAVPIAARAGLLGISPADIDHDWTLWLLAGLAAVYTPLVLALGATDIAFGQIANPLRIFDCMFRLRRIYVGTLFATLALAALAVAASTTASAIERAIPTPILGSALAELPMLAVVAVLGYAISVLAHVHGDLLGWGTAELLVDPLFPRMVAEGRRKVAARPTETASAEPGAAPAAEVTAQERADATKLANALKAEEMARALRIFESRASWAPDSVTDRQLVILAKAASRARKVPLAQQMLEQACERKGRSAGQAWIALAQLHGDALGQPDKARDIYRQVVDQFPGTDVAKLAAAQLAPAS